MVSLFLTCTCIDIMLTWHKKDCPRFWRGRPVLLLIDGIFHGWLVDKKESLFDIGLQCRTICVVIHQFIFNSSLIISVLYFLVSFTHLCALLFSPDVWSIGIHFLSCQHSNIYHTNITWCWIYKRCAVNNNTWIYMCNTCVDMCSSKRNGTD